MSELFLLHLLIKEKTILKRVSEVTFLNEKFVGMTRVIKALGELLIRALAFGAAGPNLVMQTTELENLQYNHCGNVMCLLVDDKFIEQLLSLLKENLKTSQQYFLPFISKQTNYPLESKNPIQKSLVRRLLFCAIIIFFLLRCRELHCLLPLATLGVTVLRFTKREKRFFSRLEMVPGRYCSAQ